METTVPIEFPSDTHQHVKELEHQLKHIHDVKVDLVEPRDHTAPALVAVGIDKTGARAEAAAQNVAQVLFNFLHDEASGQSQRTISLITIEGEPIDSEPLTVPQITELIYLA